jgi:uncharacterized membrane protein
MRLLRVIAFVPIVGVIWAATDGVIQVAYQFTPSDDKIVSGSFTAGHYRFDMGLFALLVFWTIICLTWTGRGLYRLIVHGVPLHKAF